MDWFTKHNNAYLSISFCITNLASNQWLIFASFSWNSLILGQHNYIKGWVGGKQVWGGWWQRLKQRSKKTQIVEFRVAITCTCTHKGPIFHCKAQTNGDPQQWEPYKVSTAKLELSIGAISPVVELHDWQKALWKSEHA